MFLNNVNRITSDWLRVRIKKRLVIFGMVLILIIVGFSGCIQENLVSFETVEKGTYCFHEEKIDYVITNNSEWENLYDLLYFMDPPSHSPLEIDFDNYTVLAVFRGCVSLGGNSIEITKIVENENSIVVYVKEISHGSGGECTGLAWPYHIVKTQKIDKEIVFNHETS